MSVSNGCSEDTTRDTRHPGAFSKISLGGIGRVEFIQADETSVEVTAPPRLIDHVVTEVFGDTLHLALEPERWFTHIGKVSLEYRVTGPVCRGLSIDGVGSIDADSIETDALAVEIDGAGKVSVGRLRSGTLETSLDGSGRVSFGRAEIERFCRGNIDGAGKITFDELAAASLGFRVEGAGRVEAAGQVREVSIAIDGTGKLLLERLQCERAAVSISGTGKVTVWPRDHLEARVSGYGKIQYRGDPRVESQIGGFGRVTPLAENRSF